MDFAAENEETSGGGQSGAEGARLGLESDGERVRGTGGAEEAGGGEAGSALDGTGKIGEGAGGGRRAGMRVDLTVVKQEVVDWSETEQGVLNDPWAKQEVEDGPEVKEEKPGTLEVKQETDSNLMVKEEEEEEPEVKEEKVKVKEEVTDWLEVTEEKKGSLEIKREEVFLGQNIKTEERVDGMCVKEEKNAPKEEVMADAQVKEEPQMHPPVGSKRKLAMSRCETCGTEEAKYRCPRCMRHSCSLPCVKKHKADLTCNGVRDKTAYVSIQQFTEMNLLSDYRFLEDVARTADHISRDAFLKRPISNKHMYFMKNRARKQGIDLKLLPIGFTKRKENSTFFDKKKRQFCWHVKLQFPQSQAVYVEKRVPDDRTINEILRPYIDPEKSDPVIRQRWCPDSDRMMSCIRRCLRDRCHGAVSVPLTTSKLVVIVGHGFSNKTKYLSPNCVHFSKLKAYIRSQTGVQILMKVEHMQQNSVRYYELDPDKSLLDNLRSKVVIEYPTLHVVLKGHSVDLRASPGGLHHFGFPTDSDEYTNSLTHVKFNILHFVHGPHLKSRKAPPAFFIFKQ